MAPCDLALWDNGYIRCEVRHINFIDQREHFYMKGVVSRPFGAQAPPFGRKEPGNRKKQAQSDATSSSRHILSSRAQINDLKILATCSCKPLQD